MCSTGTPSTESLKGITKKEREQQGKKGGVVRMAYLTALAPRLGENSFQTLGGSLGTPPQMDEVGPTIFPPDSLKLILRSEWLDVPY